MSVDIHRAINMNTTTAQKKNRIESQMLILALAIASKAIEILITFR